MTTFAITYTKSNLQNRAEQLAQKLSLDLVDKDNNSYDYLLTLTEAHLELRVVKENYSPLVIDFLSGKIAYREQHLQNKNELIAKAIGIKKNKHLSVLDATAGLGRDSFILANLGCQVLMLERSAILFQLLQDGLERYKVHTENNKDISLNLIHADAKNFLTNLAQEQYPDVIYCDPMYPERKKSALVKKEMRILKDLLGNDLDAADLLNIARHKAARVVVKRPRLAEYLADQKPNFSYTGTNTRFDVYLNSR